MKQTTHKEELGTKGRGYVGCVGLGERIEVWEGLCLFLTMMGGTTWKEINKTSFFFQNEGHNHPEAGVHAARELTQVLLQIRPGSCILGQQTKITLNTFQLEF